MRKILFFVKFVFFHIILLAQAEISFKSKYHDFGKVNEDGGEIYFDCIFKNTGNSALTLTNVKASCGCTTPDWPKYPIAPGKTGIIHVSYNPANRPGPFNKSINVSSNAKTPLVVLKIHGEVIPRKKTITDLYPDKIGDIMLENSTFSFSKIYKDAKKTDSLRIFNNTKKDIIIKFEQVPKHLKLYTIPKIIKAGKSGKIVGVYNAGLKNDWGYVSDNVFLRINGIRQTKALKISARIVENFKKLTNLQKLNAPKIMVDKRLIDLGRLKTNSINNFSFKVTNKGKSVLKIRKIDLACSCFKLKSNVTDIKPGETAILDFEINTKQRKGKLHKIISIISNSPQNSILRLQIKAIIE